MLSAVTNGAHIFFFLSIGKIALDDQKFAVSVFRNKIKKKSCFSVSVFRCFGVSLFRGLAPSALACQQELYYFVCIKMTMILRVSYSLCNRVKV